MIVAGTIVASDIAAGTITANEIAASTITGAKIAATTIAAGNIVANTITAAQIAAGTITATEIAAATITGAKIAATTIAASNIISGTITTTQIASATIVAGNIAAATITGSLIASTTITSGNIAAGAIVAGKISAGAIDAANLIVNNLIVTGHIVGGSVTKGHPTILASNTDYTLTGPSGNLNATLETPSFTAVAQGIIQITASISYKVTNGAAVAAQYYFQIYRRKTSDSTLDSGLNGPIAMTQSVAASATVDYQNISYTVVDTSPPDYACSYVLLVYKSQGGTYVADSLRLYAYSNILAVELKA
jgi:hypothetical protein